jgi:hypothetical protein
MAFLAPEVTGGVVVAYVADGRLKFPKDTQKFALVAEQTSANPGSRRPFSVPTPNSSARYPDQLPRN